MTQTHDPFAEAMNPTPPANVVYGQILFDIYFCALIKGQGKVVFDPTQHNPRQRKTAVKIDIVPLPETGMSFDVSREFIAEFPKDGWLMVTLPSLRDDCGITDLSGLSEQYVKAEMVVYGSYTKKDGSEGDLSAPKILAIYPDRESCLEAWETDEPEKAAKNEIPGFDKPADIDAINEELYGSSGNGDKPVNEAQRKVALGFLPGIVRSCRQPDNNIDLAALTQKLAETPLIKDYFTMASPEVLAEVEKAMAEPAF